MKLILIRHGETEWVRNRMYQGSADVPLNARGLRQARLVARSVGKEQPFAIYASERTRVLETARMLGRTCSRKVIVDPRLNELSFGRWEGYSFEDVYARYPKEVRQWYRAAWSSRPLGGESLKSLKSRVCSFFEQLKEKFAHRKGTCVVVTHGGPIRMFFVCTFRMSPELFWSLRVDPASIHVFDIKKNYQEVVLLNSQFHLDGCVTNY